MCAHLQKNRHSSTQRDAEPQIQNMQKKHRNTKKLKQQFMKEHDLHLAQKEQELQEQEQQLQEQEQRQLLKQRLYQQQELLRQQSLTSPQQRPSLQEPRQQDSNLNPVSIVRLNVGGKRFCTTLSSLRCEQMEDAARKTVPFGYSGPYGPENALSRMVELDLSGYWGPLFLFLQEFFRKDSFFSFISLLVQSTPLSVPVLLCGLWLRCGLVSSSLFLLACCRMNGVVFAFFESSYLFFIVSVDDVSSDLLSFFSNRQIESLHDECGYFFIDRSGRVFDLVLEYLRTGKIISLPSKGISKARLIDELVYFQIFRQVIVSPPLPHSNERNSTIVDDVSFISHRSNPSLVQFTTRLSPTSSQPTRRNSRSQGPLSPILSSVSSAPLARGASTSKPASSAHPLPVSSKNFFDDHQSLILSGSFSPPEYSEAYSLPFHATSNSNASSTCSSDSSLSAPDAFSCSVGRTTSHSLSSNTLASPAAGKPFSSFSSFSSTSKKTPASYTLSTSNISVPNASSSSSSANSTSSTASVSNKVSTLSLHSPSQIVQFVPSIIPSPTLLVPSGPRSFSPILATRFRIQKQLREYRRLAEEFWNEVEENTWNAIEVFVTNRFFFLDCGGVFISI